MATTFRQRGAPLELRFAFDTAILNLSAPAGGSMNTIRNGADADGSIVNAFCGLKP